MIIYCNTTEQFFDAIAELVQRGLTFTSHVENLTIKLTGGI